MSAADLTEAQRTAVGEFLSKPLDFPPELKNWLSDYLAVNTPYIPVSQLLGYKGTLANNKIYNPEEDGSGGDRTWQDLATPGPTIAQLADGTYFACWGCKTGRGGAGNSTTRVGPSINGADPTVYAEFHTTDPDAMIWRAAVLTLKNNDNSTVSLKYWWDNNGGAVGQFLHRWLTVIRIT